MQRPIKRIQVTQNKRERELRRKEGNQIKMIEKHLNEDFQERKEKAFDSYFSLALPATQFGG